MREEERGLRDLATGSWVLAWEGIGLRLSPRLLVLESQAHMCLFLRVISSVRVAFILLHL